MGSGHRFAYAITLVAALLIGCSPSEEAGQQRDAGTTDVSVLSVYVVNYPLQYFAERIGGDLVRVEFPAPADVDPAYWTPGVAVVAGYQAADLILLNGAGYEGWVEKTTLPASKLVNTSESFADRYIALEGAMTHSHGPEGEHEHGALAFTTWLDPTLAIEQARAIKDAFVDARPEGERGFDERFRAIEAELEAFDEELSQLTAGVSDRALLASHPVYQYLARRYALDMRSVHFEPDEDPGEQGWRELEGMLRDRPAAWMIWEAEPLPATEERLRGLGVSIVIFDPCFNTPAEGDWLTVMRRNAENMAVVFEG